MKNSNKKTFFSRHCEEAHSADEAISAQSAVISNECERSAVCCRLCRSQSSNHPIFKSSAVLGFTLMELLITISIIIVLSVVSYPIYRTRNADAKIAEGYALLGKIVDAQKDYYNEYGMFLQGNFSSYKLVSGYSCREDVLGINAINNRYFTSFAVNADDVYVRGDKGFIAAVRSSKAGTLSLRYDLTQRYDIQYKK